MGDAEYLAAFQQVVLPIAYQYNPQLVLVAAGFDAAQGDPLGGYSIEFSLNCTFILFYEKIKCPVLYVGCKVTPEGYGQMTHMLTSLAQGRVALLLEGGYNLNSISFSMMMCAKALLGDPLPTPQIGPLNPSALQTIRRVINIQRACWSALDFMVDLPDKDVLHDNKKESVEEDIGCRLSQLQLDGPQELAVADAPGEAKTLQEFLLLPENVQVPPATERD